MKRATYLKQIRALDHKFLMAEISQIQYAAKRNKLAKQWVRSELKRLEKQAVLIEKQRKILKPEKPAKIGIVGLGAMASPLFAQAKAGIMELLPKIPKAAKKVHKVVRKIETSPLFAAGTLELGLGDGLASPLMQTTPTIKKQKKNGHFLW